MRACSGVKPSHYVVKDFDNCKWPEGSLTCRLLGVGAKLKMVGLHARLSKQGSDELRQRFADKYTYGNASLFDGSVLWSDLPISTSPQSPHYCHKPK